MKTRSQTFSYSFLSVPISDFNLMGTQVPAQHFLCLFHPSGCFSDALVEEEIGGVSVADIFKRYGEGFFRDKEVS